MDKIHTLINQLPKSELHLHIEGSLSPEMMMRLAKKHSVTLPYASLEEVEKAYNFENLQSFLDLYYLGASVLIEEQDFYDLMWAYLLKCREDNVVHAEIMFDPQTHLHRDIPFEVFMSGFKRAIAQAKGEWGMSVMLILSYLRHLPESDALKTLELATDYLPDCVAAGLDSSEMGNPPENFERVFAKSAEAGLRKVVHAGEEGPPEYIWSALKVIGAERIDHGVRSAEDPELLKLLIEQQIPLTVCPLSNVKLRVFDEMKDHNMIDLLDQGVMVTVNADDPSYFGGFLNENYRALHDAFDLSEAQLVQLVKNSFIASFLPDSDKQKWCGKVDEIVATEA